MDATTFPLPFEYHALFCAIAGIFFLLQFIRNKKPYELLMAIAMPASLLIYIDKEKVSLFYAVGLLELILFFSAILFAIIGGVRKRRGNAAAAESKQEKGE